MWLLKLKKLVLGGLWPALVNMAIPLLKSFTAAENGVQCAARTVHQYTLDASLGGFLSFTSVPV
jgi:hypothetical protein